MNMQSGDGKRDIARMIAPLVGGFIFIGFASVASAAPPPPAPAPPPAAPAEPPPPAAPTDLPSPPPPPAPTMAPSSAAPAPTPMHPKMSGQTWASPMPPSQWQPQRPPISPWPTRIDYEDGDIVLPGYRVKTRPSRGLFIGGLVTFMVPYGLSFIGAGLLSLTGSDRDRERYGALLVPVVGPFITLGIRDNPDETDAFLYLANGYAQTAGAAMMVAGILMPEKYLERMASLPGKPQLFFGPNSAALRLRF